MIQPTRQLLLLVLLTASAAAGAIGFEPPLLADRVAAGELAPMQERLPLDPLVSRHPHEEARYGGDLRLLFAKPKDIRQMVVYGYSRLVGYDQNLELQPDILKDYSVEEGRIFTFRLREGHRWSDGQPFTTEDLRYYWEDIANNEGLSPFGPPQAMLVEDKPPRVDIIDDHTIRYSWHKPNPVFLTKLAEPSPLFIYAPAHYLRQFHERYNDPAVLERKVKESGRRNWVSLHHFSNRQYKLDNPELPSLQPWVNTTRQPAERFIFVRNPFFHRVDQAGRQLPYIDRVTINIADKSLIAAKTGSGESDLRIDPHPRDLRVGPPADPVVGGEEKIVGHLERSPQPEDRGNGDFHVVRFLGNDQVLGILGVGNGNDARHPPGELQGVAQIGDPGQLQPPEVEPGADVHVEGRHVLQVVGAAASHLGTEDGDPVVDGPLEGAVLPVEVHAEIEPVRDLSRHGQADHVEPHLAAIIDDAQVDWTQALELIDVIAIGIRVTARGLAVLVLLEPHHLRLGAVTQFESMVLLELLVDAPEISARI